MMHVIEQTRDEKIAMYMKLTKRELAEMLASTNEAISSLAKEKTTRWVELPSRKLRPKYGTTTDMPDVQVY